MSSAMVSNSLSPIPRPEQMEGSGHFIPKIKFEFVLQSEGCHACVFEGIPGILKIFEKC